MRRMLGLLSAQTWENPGRMARWRCRLQKGYGTEVTERTLFGRTVLHCKHGTIDGLTARQKVRRQRNLTKRLADKGVEKVAISRETPADFLVGLHIPQMDAGFLHTYLAGDVGAHVAERSGATAVCFFRSVGGAEERAILKMAEQFRYLQICTQRDGAAVCQALRRRYGLPVVEAPTPSQVRRADFALVFHPPERTFALSGQCLVFAPEPALWGGIPGGQRITGLGLQLSRQIAAELPDGFAPDPILSEAAFRGLIDPGNIKIQDVFIETPRI